MVYKSQKKTTYKPFWWRNDSYVTAYEVNITQHRIYNWCA